MDPVRSGGTSFLNTTMGGLAPPITRLYIFNQWSAEVEFQRNTNRQITVWNAAECIRA
jgi:hypothetical protein